MCPNVVGESDGGRKEKMGGVFELASLAKSLVSRGGHSGRKMRVEATSKPSHKIINIDF